VQFPVHSGAGGLQHRFAQQLDSLVEPTAAQAIRDIDDQAAQIWSFASERSEAQTIAAFIASDIAASNRTAEDYALVARQKVANFEPVLRDALAEKAIALRDDDAVCGEMRLQDLLKDPYSELLIGLLRLGARTGKQQGSPRTWIEVSRTIARLRSGDDLADERAAYSDDQLSKHLKALRVWLQDHPCSKDHVAELFEMLKSSLETLTNGQLGGLVDGPDELAIRHEAFLSRLSSVVAHCNSWWDVVSAYEASDAVSLLTIHRSKGQEYHTVFFLALDNDQWWSHARDTTASTSTFFVGLSRAGQRLIFTQCDQRGGQGNIADLYAVLAEAGIEVHRFE
jgi:hypothetical protein